MRWNLHKLLAEAGIHPPPEVAALEVDTLRYDSRLVEPGGLFFALPGEKDDGARYAVAAAAKGAVAIVAEAAIPDCPKPVVRVSSARAAMADVANVFYDRPSLKLRTVGITGTNGKTTTAFLVKHLCDSALKRCGLIGTVRYVIGDEVIDASRTTPESIDVQEMLFRMIASGDRAVAMEVSSHALAQDRTRAVEWDAAIFSNLTQDHLDYHKTMDAYFDAKALLFEGLAKQRDKRGKAIINADDRFGHRMLERMPKQARPITYGLGVGSAFQASDIRFDATGTQYKLEAKGRQYLVRLPLIGTFNVYNSLAALAAVSALGLELRAAVSALAAAPQVPGRLERVPSRRSFQVYVDYAHTDDALSNALRTLRELRPRHLLAVFGCGGDRDRAKRPLMARAAEQFADYVVITSDNPRKEDPEKIVADIKAGMRGAKYEVEVDRAAAIRRAVQIAEPGDIVLIAGKGHENYQEFADRRITFDDVSIARSAIDDKPAAT